MNVVDNVYSPKRAMYRKKSNFSNTANWTSAIWVIDEGWGWAILEICKLIHGPLAQP